MTLSTPLTHLFLEGTVVGPTPTVEGTNDATVVAYEVNDATKDFTGPPDQVYVGDIVVNNAGAFATVLTVAATKLTLDTDLALGSGDAYKVLFSEDAFNVTSTATNDKPFSMFLNVGDPVEGGPANGNTYTRVGAKIVALSIDATSGFDVMTLSVPLLIGSLPAGIALAVFSANKINTIALPAGPFMEVYCDQSFGIDLYAYYRDSGTYLDQIIMLSPEQLADESIRLSAFQMFRNAIEAAGRNKGRNTNAPIDPNRNIISPGAVGLYVQI